MKAWVLHNIGDIRFEDVPTPEPQPGEALVKVRCTGVCSSDIPRIFVTGTYNYPLIPGHEFSGETESGRRVAVFPLLPCFKCPSCESGAFETCSAYGYIGSRRDGAFAEYVAVPEWNLIDIPESMSFEQAALLEPAAVAHHAAGRVDLTDVKSAAVVGTGIIGQLAARWLELADIDSVELLGRGSKPRLSEYDVCFEVVGSVDAFRRCVELVRPLGKIVLVGNPEPTFNMERNLYWQLLRKQITTAGVWNSRYPAEWQKVIENANRLGLDSLISHSFPLDKADAAFGVMRNEKHQKVMLVM